MKKMLLRALAVLATAALIGTIGPIQRAIAQGMVHFTALVGTEQISLNYPCTVSCYVTPQDIATFIQGSSATGTVSVPRGGTGVGTLTARGVVVGEGTSAVGVTAAGTTGQLLMATTSADPAFTTALSGSYTLSGTNTFSGQLLTTFGTPTITSGACGTTTNGVITSGTNQAGLVTIGSATTTTCTINFSTTITAPNACLLFPASAGAAAAGTTVARVSSITTTTFVITGSALASTAYYYLCI